MKQPCPACGIGGPDLNATTHTEWPRESDGHGRLAGKLVILGPPRTKKTHQRILRRKGRPFVMPAATSVAWEQSAVLQLRSQYKRAPITWPVNIAARVYRDRAVGDFVGYLQAICDALEKAGVLVNDKFVSTLDGSRLLVDKANPRVEVELSW